MAGTSPAISAPRCSRNAALRNPRRSSPTTSVVSTSAFDIASFNCCRSIGCSSKGSGFLATKVSPQEQLRPVGDGVKLLATLTGAPQHAYADDRGEHDRRKRVDVDRLTDVLLRLDESPAYDSTRPSQIILQQTPRVVGVGCRLRDRVDDQTAAPLRVVGGETNGRVQEIPESLQSPGIARYRAPYVPLVAVDG